MCIFPILLKWQLSYVIITKTRHIYPIDGLMYVLFLVLLFFWLVGRGNYVHFCNFVKMYKFHWKSIENITKERKRGREREREGERDWEGERERDSPYVCCVLLFFLVGWEGELCAFLPFWLKCIVFIGNHKKTQKRWREEGRERERERGRERDWEGEREVVL